jgi:hypothetical protein
MSLNGLWCDLAATVAAIQEDLDAQSKNETAPATFNAEAIQEVSSISGHSPAS